MSLVCFGQLYSNYLVWSKGLTAHSVESYRKERLNSAQETVYQGLRGHCTLPLGGASGTLWKHVQWGSTFWASGLNTLSGCSFLHVTLKKPEMESQYSPINPVQSLNGLKPLRTHVNYKRWGSNPQCDISGGFSPGLSDILIAQNSTKIWFFW